MANIYYRLVNDTDANISGSAGFVNGKLCIASDTHRLIYKTGNAVYRAVASASETLGDTLYASAANTLSLLAGNTTTTRKFLRQTGTGTASAAPVWDTLLAADIPDISATYQPLDADLTAFAAISRARGMLITGGASTWQGLAAPVAASVLGHNTTDAVWCAVTLNYLTMGTANGIGASLLSQDGTGIITKSPGTDGNSTLKSVITSADNYAQYNAQLSTDANASIIFRYYGSNYGTANTASIWGITLDSIGFMGAGSAVNGFIIRTGKLGGYIAFGENATETMRITALTISTSMAALTGAGQADSIPFIWRGQSYDASAAVVEWKAYNDVTSNAGASTWTLQSRIGAAAPVTRLTVTDDGALGVSAATVGSLSGLVTATAGLLSANSGTASTIVMWGAAGLTAVNSIISQTTTTNIVITDTNTLTFVPNYAGLGDVPAGVLIQTGGAGISHSLRAGSVNSTAGAIGAYVYNGTAYKSAWEVANVASGLNHLQLMKSVGLVSVGAGVTAHAWSSSFQAMQFGGNGALFWDITAGHSKQFDMCQNMYYDGAWKYQSTDEASQISQTGGRVVFYTVASGSAGAATGSMSGFNAFDVGTTAIIGNESGRDIDYRYEGSGASGANLFTIDAGALTVNVGGSVEGSIAAFGASSIALKQAITLSDAVNIAVNTTTGTKFGTATNQKMAWWNATPVVQPAAVADATSALDIVAQFNTLLARLRAPGIIAT